VRAFRRQGAKTPRDDHRPPGVLASWRLGACVLGLLTVACSGERQDPTSGSAPLDSADQVMMGLKQYMTKDGVRTAYLEADTAFIYETRGRIDLANIRVTFYSSSGEQTSVLTARRGIHNMRSNVMEAIGNVVVVRTDGARLTTSHLIYDQPRNEVRTDSAYSYASADRDVRGDGFTSDPTFTNIQSRRLRGRAGSFTLPNQ